MSLFRNSLRMISPALKKARNLGLDCFCIKIRPSKDIHPFQQFWPFQNTVCCFGIRRSPIKKTSKGLCSSYDFIPIWCFQLFQIRITIIAHRSFCFSLTNQPLHDGFHLWLRHRSSVPDLLNRWLLPLFRCEKSQRQVVGKLIWYLSSFPLSLTAAS